MPFDDSGFGKIIGEVVFNTIARVALPIVSFGYGEVEPVMGPILPFNRFGIRRRPDGGVVLSTNAGTVVGLALAALAVVAGFCLI